MRFAGLLTEAKVDSYLRKICEVLDCGVSTGPVNPVCGPSGPRWTMPLPGEWMRYPGNYQSTAKTASSWAIRLRRGFELAGGGPPADADLCGSS